MNPTMTTRQIGRLKIKIEGGGTLYTRWCAVDYNHTSHEEDLAIITMLLFNTRDIGDIFITGTAGVQPEFQDVDEDLYESIRYGEDALRQ